jgi:hypothetical protein
MRCQAAKLLDILKTTAMIATTQFKSIRIHLRASLTAHKAIIKSAPGRTKQKQDTNQIQNETVHMIKLSLCLNKHYAMKTYGGVDV